MDRHTFSSGFLLAETCIAVMAVSMLSLLYLQFPSFDAEGYYRFSDSYHLTQSCAMLTAHSEVFHHPAAEVYFNGSGNVRSAATVHFPNRNCKIIIELGGGKLVKK